MEACLLRNIGRVAWTSSVIGVLLVLGAATAHAEETPPVRDDRPALAAEALTTTASDLAAAAPTYRRQARGPRAGRGRWTVALEGGLSLFEDPSGFMGEPLPAGLVPFRWDAQDFGSAFGGRLTVRYRASGRDTWEVRGAYAGQWDEQSRQQGQFGFRATPGSPLILSPARVSATLHNQTDIWGGELNYWRTLRCDDCWHFRAGVGARYQRIDDQVKADQWAGFAPDSFLVADVENGFLGAQLMAAVQFFPRGRFQVGASLKAMLGAMNRDMTETDTSIVTGGVTLDAAREETNFAWGAEAEVSARYRLGRRIAVTAAYTVLILDEVGRADAVLDFAQAATGSLQLRDDADIAVVHSFHLGLSVDL